MSCLEQNFAMIGTIEAFDLNQITPEQNLYIPKRFFRKVEAVAFPKGGAVPLYPKSAKLSENAIQSRGGNGYDVSLSWQVRGDKWEDIEVLDMLKNSHKCFRITAFGGNEAYILSDAEHYQFDYQRSGEMIDCSLKVYNINGIQQML